VERLVPGSKLNCERRGAQHPEMRAVRVTERVPAELPNASSLAQALDRTMHLSFRERRSIHRAEHAWPSKMTMLLERLVQSNRHRDDALAPAFWRSDDLAPHVATNCQGALLEVDVFPLERHDLALAEPSI